MEINTKYWKKYLTFQKEYGKIFHVLRRWVKVITGMIKACNFYVSDWHLYAAMLPFIKNELQFENQVIVLSQDNVRMGMDKLTRKINVKFCNKNGLNDIIWCKEPEELEITNGVNPTNIFIQGTMSYIEYAISYIEEKYKNIYRELRIIDCYELYDSNNFLYDILDKHDYVFSTGGLKRKEYVFPDYARAKVTKG